MRRNTTPRTAGFTLIETLIVVVILSVLAGIVTPQFTDARDTTLDTTVRGQLNAIRQQIQIYHAFLGEDAYDETKDVATFWDPLLDSDLIQFAPINPMRNSWVVAAAPGPDVRWVWSLNADGDPDSLDIRAVSADGEILE